MNSEEIGNLENELGFIVSEIECLEDQLSALQEQKTRVYSELMKEKASIDENNP